MTPIVQKLKDVKPDILIAISFPNDAILFQRKAKELDFNVAAFIGVSAGYSSPDLRDFDRRHGQRHLRRRLPAEGECQGAEARDAQGRRRVLQALRSQDEAPAGRPRRRRLLGDLGAVHRRAAEGQDLRAGRSCATSRSSSICPKARWSTAAASSSPTSTGRTIRRTPARTCAPSIGVWQWTEDRQRAGVPAEARDARAGRWCRCRTGASAERDRLRELRESRAALRARRSARLTTRP